MTEERTAIALRCPYCGRPAKKQTCPDHSDLPGLEAHEIGGWFPPTRLQSKDDNGRGTARADRTTANVPRRTAKGASS